LTSTIVDAELAEVGIAARATTANRDLASQASIERLLVQTCENGVRAPTTILAVLPQRFSPIAAVLLQARLVLGRATAAGFPPEPPRLASLAAGVSCRRHTIEFALSINLFDLGLVTIHLWILVIIVIFTLLLPKIFCRLLVNKRCGFVDILISRIFYPFLLDGVVVFTVLVLASLKLRFCIPPCRFINQGNALLHHTSRQRHTASNHGAEPNPFDREQQAWSKHHHDHERHSHVLQPIGDVSKTALTNKSCTRAQHK